MNTRHFILSAGVMFWGSLLLAADPAPPPASVPAVATAPQPPSDPAAIKGIEVHDWVILISNPYKPTANSPDLVRSSLPENVATRRPSVPGSDPLAKAPSPMGMIRLYGEPRAEVDVLLEIKAGEFLGAHPHATRKAQRLLWERLAATSDPTQVTPIRPEHWLSTWRGGPALYLTSRDVKEQWLIYDAEFQYKSPLSLAAAGPMRYGMVNAGESPLHDVTIYKPGDDGWRTATRDEVPGRKPLVPPAPAGAASAGPFDAKPPAAATPPPPTVAVPARVIVQVRPGPGAPAGVPFVAVPTATATAIAAGAAVTAAANEPGAGPPAPVPADESKDDASARLARLSGEPQKDAAKLLEPWRRRLLAMGFFEQDVAAILAEIKQHALDEKRLTAVYSLDPAELEKMLPLDVTPTPSRKVRIGLVILTGADPGKKDQVGAWIEQLGDPQWAHREEAEKLITAEGPGAMAQLQEALEHKDREISFRAERIIEAIAPPELDGNGNLKR